MDAKIFQEAKGFWHVNASPTMRSLGEVIQQPDRTLWIKPDRDSAFAGIAPGPYRSIEDVANAVALYLGGQCSKVGRKPF